MHLVANYLDLPVRPAILGIFGRPGDGKSAQLACALDRCNVEVLRVNAADLESGVAGEPGRLIARTYQAASKAIENGVPTALVVDDIDTTVGEWEKNTGTVNHQQVLAELMHIADRPIDIGRGYHRRAPIFVTGNNLSRLYPPLRRHRRMSVFEWRPTRTEIRDVVCSLFAKATTREAIERLVVEFEQEPLAFFAELQQSIREAYLDVQVEQVQPTCASWLRPPPRSTVVWSGKAPPLRKRSCWRLRVRCRSLARQHFMITLRNLRGGWHE